MCFFAPPHYEGKIVSTFDSKLDFNSNSNSDDDLDGSGDGMIVSRTSSEREVATESC